MTIIIIGPAYPYRGGIADTNESFCRALNKIGHDSSIFTFTLQYPSILFPGKSQYQKGPSPKDLKIRRKISTINPISWWIASKEINNLKPDIVIFRFWLPFLGPCLGSIARLLNKNIKKIAFCDNVIPHEKRIGDYLFTKYFTRAFDGFICMSKSVQYELKTFTNRTILNIPHPINDNLGKVQDRDMACLKLGLDPNFRYLLSFGLVRKYKGLKLTLEAMANPNVKHLKLIIAGEWYEDKTEYERLIKDLGIEKNVIIIDRYILTEEIQYYFSVTDLVIQTYITASQSGITQMALNFEKPILVTNVGGLSEVVIDGKTGYLSSKNPEDIANIINNHFTNLKTDFFQKNIQIEKNKYSWNTFSQKVVTTFANSKSH